MDPLAARVRRTIRRLDLAPRRARIAAAVSGGADSVALAHVLKELQDAGECTLAGLAHLNHRLRGDAADQDEAFCRSLAARFDVPFESDGAEVSVLARQRRVSVESASHDARYEFLERAATRLHADRIALGHTRDDQAETFLLRLLRGAGPHGLGGMYPRAGVFIRPMLDCSRSEVRDYIRVQGIEYRDDATNRDTTIPRNWVRHDLLPALERFSPAAVRVLARDAALARDDAAVLDALAGSALDRIGNEEGGAFRLNCAMLADEPPAIARRVVALALGRLAGCRFVGFEHLDRIVALASRASGQILLPGARVDRTANFLTLLPVATGTRGRISATPFGTNSFRFSLSIPGEVVSDLGWAVESERTTLCGDTAALARETSVGGRSAVLDLAALALPLSIRNWRQGDRFRPLGVGGSKKLQDYFVDRKVPRPQRGRVPLVVTGDDRVAWVAGHGIAEDFRVTAATADVVILKLKYWSNGT